MSITASTPEEYIAQLPDDRKEAIGKLRKTILENLPEGFMETMAYGMISYSVSREKYPKGYHADPSQALPFISIASQKNHIALYHMGIYSISSLNTWFTNEYAKQGSTKLDMGKSCIRFRKAEHIPWPLIAELAGRVSVDEWIGYYEQSLQSSRR